MIRQLEDAGRLKKELYEVVMRLVRWEYDERASEALMTLDLGYKLNKIQTAMCWCLLATKDEGYRKELVGYLRERYGVWHKEDALLARSVAAPYDLATFLIHLQRDVHYGDALPQQPWYKAFREAMALQDGWTVAATVRLFVSVQSSFGHDAVTQYYLTPRQQERYRGLMGKPFLASARDCIDHLVIGIR
jgi:hypothetical protein